MWRKALAMGFLILCMMGQGFAADYPLKVSDNQRYIVDSSGKPFFWQADTSWNLFAGVSKEDVTKYLDDRQEKGYNVIMSCALFKNTNVYGDKAWTGAWGTTPNEAFWEHVDWVVQEVEKRGMVMGFLPSWSRVDNNFEGLTGHNAYDQVTLQNPASVIAYGNFLGQRYGSYKNFVWILGGDVTPKHIRAEDCRRLANAIEDGQGGHTRLMTYHNSDQGNWNDADHGIGSVYLSNEPWLDIYGHHNETSGQLILSDYQLSPTKPIINLEPRYEELFVNRHDYDQRRDIIRSLFSGALGGLVYGADPVWNIGDDAWQFDAEHWEAHLDLPGAKQSTYIREMMEEWRWYETTPHVLDTKLSVGSTYVPALLANNKEYGLVYFMNKQSTQTITINMDTFEPSSVKAQWFDATNGTYQSAGSFSNSGTKGFTTPGANSRGTYDWILCLGEKPAEEPVDPVVVDVDPILHFDASTLPLGTISQWNDISGNNNNAIAPAGKAPQVVVGDKGTPVIRFDGVDDHFTFSKIKTIRTVFMVLKEDADADKGEYAAFLLGDSGAFHFHRGYKNIFAPSWSSSHIRNGVLKVNGVAVDGTKTAMPEEYSVISIVTTGNVYADSLVFDRSFAGKRHWDGDVAEVIIYDVPLNSSQVASVENTLTAKWLTASSNNAPDVDAGSGASITLPNNSLALNGTSVDDGLPSNTLTRSWSKVSGPGSVSFSNASSDDTTATFSAAGSYVLRLSVSDGVLSSSDDVTVVVEEAVVVESGEIRVDYWYGISGHNISSFTSLASFPNSPDASAILDSFELPLKHADNYGARVTGLLRPQVSGSYTFWIAADDTSRLLLSTDENESNKVEIAKTSWWTPSRAWDLRAEQKSIAINLEAGKSYFIEGLMKEGAGGDNLSVAWEGPGISRAVIDGAYFTEAPVTPGEIRVDYWSGIAGDNIAALTELATFPNSPEASETLDSFELPVNQADNFGARVTGLLKPQVSGAYTFWIAADNNSRLFLSTDASENNKVLIAKTTLWTHPRAWDTRAEQKSVEINLEAGKSYFIEGLVKEGGGGDHLSVAWQGPGFTRSVIASDYFSDEPISEPDNEEDTIVDNGSGNDGNGDGMGDSEPTEPIVGNEFVLGINLGGDPVIIDGQEWLSNTEARILGMSYTAAYSARTNVVPEAGADSDTDAMLNSAIWDLGDNWGIEIPINNGTYQVYFWVMENSGSYYRNFDVIIEGDLPVSDVGNLAKGEWVKYGPFNAVVNDGLLNIDLDVEYGDGHIMGVAIYK